MLSHSDEYKYIILEGDSQIGKSSLLKKLYIDFLCKDKFPLLINASNIKDDNIDKIFKKLLNNQYNNANYDEYKQLHTSEKILFIDDFQKIGLISNKVKDFIESIKKIFGKIYITFDSIHGDMPKLQSVFNEFQFYSIKSLGFKKTHDLIKKHFSLIKNPLTIEKQDFIDKTRYTFDQLRVVLGNKVIPSYPIFILSILQTLKNSSFDLKETSYAYCYQSLIHYALASKASIANDDLGQHMNFLKNLAFHFHKMEYDYITIKNLKKFYDEYAEKFIIINFENLIQNLLNSQIIIKDEDLYRFGYKYILYFLAAKYISDIINTEEGKQIVTYLFDNLHSEKNANILVFITHHTNDISFIYDSMFNAMVPFENVEPITLNREDPYYVTINNVTKILSNDLIEQDHTPEEEIEKQLIVKDEAELEREKIKNKHGNTEDADDIVARPFLQAFRSIDIVGQIVKNRKGDLDKRKIEELITEIYYTGFRTIGYLGKIFSDAHDELVDNLMKKFHGNELSYEIKQKIFNFIQIISLQTCLGVFSKLIFAVGIKDLNEIFDNVATSINTPAAKLVSFSINSYYNDMSVGDVIELSQEFKKNPVAMSILKSRVRAYIYTNHVSYRKKQKIAQALGMKILQVTNNKPNQSFRISY